MLRQTVHRLKNKEACFSISSVCGEVGQKLAFLLLVSRRQLSGAVVQWGIRLRYMIDVTVILCRRRRNKGDKNFEMLTRVVWTSTFGACERVTENKLSKCRLPSGDDRRRKNNTGLGTVD